MRMSVEVKNLFYLCDVYVGESWQGAILMSYLKPRNKSLGMELFEE